MSPTARTTASRCSTATASTRRSGTTCTGLARSTAAAAAPQSAVHHRRAGAGHAGERKHTNLGPRLTIVDRKGSVIARLGGEHGPGQEPGRFLAPHGLAVDSTRRHLCRRGELHQLVQQPSRHRRMPKYLRSLQKLEKVVVMESQGSAAPDRQRPAGRQRAGVPPAGRRARAVPALPARRRDRRALALGLFPAPDAARPSGHGDRSRRCRPTSSSSGTARSCARSSSCASSPASIPKTVVFETGYDKAALASYEVFKRLRAAGAIPAAHALPGLPADAAGERLPLCQRPGARDLFRGLRAGARRRRSPIS